MSKKRFEVRATVYDKRGRVLAEGKNSYVKSHPMQWKFAKQVGLSQKIYLHAEIDAIRKVKDRSKIHKIVVERYNSGKPAKSKPCPICEAAISEFGIKLVEYHSED